MTVYQTICLVLAWLLGIPAVLTCVYLALVVLFSARAPIPRRSGRQLRFDIIVPAHNEAAGIARTVTSLRQLDWPEDRFRVVVVADNCTDATASLAAGAGAQVLERHDSTRRGKGFALSFAFESSREAQWADAVVVIDADSEVSANLLEACAARIENGADAVQADYGVLNPHAAWRTRLITIALGAFHIARSRARERWRVSCGIRGNGWCVTHKLLRQVPYQAFSLTEDVEYGIDIGFAGLRVQYADEASVRGEMVSNEKSARNQRRRWEEGRLQLIAQRALPLLREALRSRSLECLDLAADLLVPPLTVAALNIMLFAAVAACGTLLLHGPAGALWVAAGCAAILVCYVLRGWQLSGVGARGLADLAWAPVYIIWKVLLLSGRRKPTEWIRTEREGS